MAKESSDSAGSGSGLGGLIGGLLGGGSKASSGGLGGIASMLDLNGDGNPLDDIIGMAGKRRHCGKSRNDGGGSQKGR